MTISKSLLASLFLLASSASFADASGEFATLLDEHWEWRMANSPVMASRLGDRRYNDQWPDDSLAAIAEDQLNYELFRRQLQDDVDVYKFNEHLMPFSHRGGIQNPENLTNQLRLVTVKDYEDWLAGPDRAAR